MHGTKADKLYDSTQLLDVTVQLDLGECGMQEVSFYHQHKNNVDFVFVDHPVYHRAGVLALEACNVTCMRLQDLPCLLMSTLPSLAGQHRKIPALLLVCFCRSACILSSHTKLCMARCYSKLAGIG